jgi:hypothetical protein
LSNLGEVTPSRGANAANAVQNRTSDHDEIIAKHDRAKLRRWAELVEQDIKPAAVALRPGVPFTLDYPTGDFTYWKEHEDEFHKKYPQGEFNIHFPITFADGVVWFARVQNWDWWIPGDHWQRFRAGEVAALRAAGELLPKLVPSVHIASTQNSEPTWFAVTSNISSLPVLHLC